jgi:hypothetical protein
MNAAAHRLTPATPPTNTIASAYTILDTEGEHIATVHFHRPGDDRCTCSTAGRWQGIQRWELGSGPDETAAAHNMTIGAVKIRDDGGETWAEQLRSAGYQVIRSV